MSERVQMIYNITLLLSSFSLSPQQFFIAIFLGLSSFFLNHFVSIFPFSLHSAVAVNQSPLPPVFFPLSYPNDVSAN